MTTVVVVALWWWSSGAADPLAPGSEPTEVVSPGPGVPRPVTPAGSTDPAALDAAPSGLVSPDGSAASGSSSPEALDRVRAAAGATAALPTATFTLTVALVDDVASWPRTEVRGAVDVRTGDVAVVLSEWDPSRGAEPTTVEAIGVDESLYVRSPSLDPPGGPPTWWRTRVGSGQPDAPAAVSDLVSLVAAAVAAEALGGGTEDGTEVTRFRVELAGTQSTAGVAGSAGGWALVGVTDDGMLRSVELRADGAWGSAAGRPVVVRLVLDAFGEPVAITVPDPALVRDLAGPAPGGEG